MEGLAGAFPLQNDSLFSSTFQTNVNLTGYGATFSMVNVAPVGGFEARHGIRLQSALDFTITGLTVRDTQGDGIYVDGLTDIGFSQNVTIQDVVIDNAFRNGIGVISVQDLLIDNSVIVNTVGTSPRAGIDFEPDISSKRIVNATVRNTVIVANGSDGIIWVVSEGNVAKPVSGLIENVTVAGNSRYGFGLDGNPSIPPGGALPNFVIKDSLVVNNALGGLQVVAGAGTQTIEYSAFFGNTGGDFVGAAAAGTGTITGTEAQSPARSRFLSTRPTPPARCSTLSIQALPRSSAWEIPMAASSVLEEWQAISMPMPVSMGSTSSHGNGANRPTMVVRATWPPGKCFSVQPAHRLAA